MLRQFIAFAILSISMATNVDHLELDNNKFVSGANTRKAANIGAAVREKMQKFRGGDEAFYRSLLEALKVKLCDQQKLEVGSNDAPAPITRFVSSESAFAYKDESGSCIQVLEPSAETQQHYDNELCEAKPNCYWMPISQSDQERFPVYAVDHTPEAPQGALTLAEADATLSEWAKGLVVFIAPGIVLGCLSAVTFILFVLCRCLCNQCGGRNPRREGYSCSEKFIPFVVFAIFSAGMVTCAAISLLYNQQVTNAVTGVFEVSTNSLNDSKAWIKTARAPLIQIKDDILNSTTDIRAALNDTDFIEGGIDGLSQQLSNFGEHTADIKLPKGCTGAAGYICVACEACTTISDRVVASNNQITARAANGIAEFQGVKHTLFTELVDISDTIKLNVDDKVATTDELLDALDRASVSVDKVQVSWDSQDSIRSVSALAMFAMGMLVIALGMVGILLKLTPFSFLEVIHIAYLVGFIALVVSFVLSSILMAISVLLSDTCEVSKIMSEDWSPALGASAVGINACFQNQSLLVAFNLTNSLEFAENLEFPDDIQVAEIMNFSTFASFADEIEETNASTFDISGLQEYLDVLNHVTHPDDEPGCTPEDGNYTIAQINTPWISNNDDDTGVSPEEYIRQRYGAAGGIHVEHCIVPGIACHRGQNPCTFEEHVWEIYSNVSDLVSVGSDGAIFVDDMKNNMSNVVSTIDNFKVNLTEFDATISDIKVSVLENLVSSVEEFKGNMYCSFVAENFEVLYTHMCVDMMPSLVMISFMILIMGIFLIPVNICLIILSKRLGVARKTRDTLKI